MRGRGKLLYLIQGSARYRTCIKIVLALWLSGGLSVVLYVATRIRQPSFALAGSLTIITGSLLAAKAALNSPLAIWENGIKCPTGPVGPCNQVYISFADIKEIRMNAEGGSEGSHIEIVRHDGTIHSFAAAWAKDGDRFRRALIEDLKGKVRVVE
jgi:hypothetical protein